MTMNVGKMYRTFACLVQSKIEGNALKGITSLFVSVVAVAFQIAFRVKMHANDIFYFLKIIFDISTSK